MRIALLLSLICWTYGVQTGIWYETWYSLHGNYTWVRGHGTSATALMLGDVDRDSRADAIAYDGNTLEWTVALSNATYFETPQIWLEGCGEGTSNQFVCDVNGDGLADALAYRPGGSWDAAPSNGRGFVACATWVNNGLPSGAVITNAMSGDVNKDGFCDGVIFDESKGTWFISLSSGHSLGAYQQWIAGHGVGSNTQLLGDVNGDGCADAIVYFGNSGAWYAALSNCNNGFLGYSQWINGHGVGSIQQMLSDTNGDGCADAVIYFTGGNWYAALSNCASGFEGPQEWKSAHGQTCTHGKCGLGIQADWVGTGNIRGNATHDPVVFFRNWAGWDGIWRALPSENYPDGHTSNPSQYNNWDSWELRYVPTGYGWYSSVDMGVIGSHLQLFADAGIDFLILDETNFLETEWIKIGALALCAGIAQFNQQNPSHRITYTLAIGAMQYTHNPADMEAEAEDAWTQFVAEPSCGGAENFFSLDGKPVLVSYVEYTDRLKFEAWTGNKTFINKFSLRWMQGTVPDIHNNPPDDSDISNQYYGWGFPYGSRDSAEVMVVMPGWNNSYVGNDPPTVVSRDNGVFYNQSCWDRVFSHSTLPNMVVVNSWNEYAEQTAVEPADTSQLMPGCDQWPTPTMYWDSTKAFIRQYEQMEDRE